MSWFRLDDQFPRHPKVLRAGTDAAWLYVAGGCYCAQYLTDGFIPKDAVAGLTSLRQPSKLTSRLVDAGLWHDRGGEYEVHDYLKYNPSREQVLEERRKASERRKKDGRASGKRRATNSRQSDDVRTNVTNPDPIPQVPTEPIAPRSARQPDLLWDAVMSACGVEGPIPDPARGAYNKAVKGLRDVGASPDEVSGRAANYRAMLPNAALTPTALARHWAELGASNVRAIHTNGNGGVRHLGGLDPNAERFR